MLIYILRQHQVRMAQINEAQQICDSKLLTELIATIDKNAIEKITPQFQCKPDEKHCAILKSRSWWTENHTKINQFVTTIVPKTHLVAHPDDGIHSEKFAKFGPDVKIYIPADNIEFRQMVENQCHDNSYILLMNGQIEEMHTGYALFNDGLWRYHSWGLDANDKIIETTHLCLIYICVEVKTED